MMACLMLLQALHAVSLIALLMLVWNNLEPRSLASVGSLPSHEVQLSSELDAERNSTFMRPRSDGVVLFANAVSGSTRAAATHLASRGYHVLVGVRNKAERNSFYYEKQRGLELVDFDITDPSTYPSLIDKLRKIKRGLDRPFVGLLVNLADGLIQSKCSSSSSIHIKDLDECYRNVVKSPVRLFEAVWELRRLQSVALMGALIGNNSTSSQSTLWSAEGTRIVLCTDAEGKRPGPAKTFQSTTVDLFVEMSQGLATNYSISIVPLVHQPTAVTLSGVKWVLENSVLLGSGGSTVLEEEFDIQGQAKSIIHAFVAANPKLHYPKWNAAPHEDSHL